MARFCENDDIRLATLRRSVSPRARKLACGLGALLLCSGILGAQTPLQIVDDVDAAKFTQHATDLAKAMKALRLGTATELEQDLKDLAEGPDKAAALKRIQQRLDTACLLGISINPESRVKVARGSAAAILVKDRDVFFLAKVQNDGGVTGSLAISGPQISSGSGLGDGRWLEFDIADSVPRKLTGQRLQYVVLRLRAHETGKREATFACDVGQGTQDLGFRAEMPILFTVTER